MRSIKLGLRQIIYENKAYRRNPAAAFFTLVFPLLFLGMLKIFGDGLVDIVEKYVKKGSKVYVEGELQTRKWQDQEGKDRYTTEVILQGYNCNLTLLDSRNNSQRNLDHKKI